MTNSGEPDLMMSNSLDGAVGQRQPPIGGFPPSQNRRRWPSM